MSTLPKGWVSTKVKNLAGTSGLFVDGDWVESKDQDPNGDIRLLQLADIGDGVFLDKSDRWINEEAFTRLRCTELETGDVLIARMPDPLGRACLMPSLQQRCVTVVDVAALRVDPQLADTRWVMHTINAPQLRAEISAQASGTTRKRISRGNLGGLQIPLPPESEQKRIADKLDTVLTRVDAVNTRLAGVTPILKRFRQSVLSAATSGRLTEDWCEECEAESRRTFALSDLVVSIDQGWSPKCEADAAPPDRWAVIKTTAIQALHFRPEENKVLPKDLDPRPKLALADGDVLITRAGPRSRAGIACIVKGDHPMLMLCDKAYRVRVDRSKVLPEMLNLLLNSPEILEVIDGMKTGISESGVNLTQAKFRELALSVPCIAEQVEIVRRVETLFAFADSLEARLKAAQTATERMTPALLAKAFRGELVPQDPNDEPASKLLRRLQQEAPSSRTKNGRKSAA
jgi:type I restriction enzyme S subunit